MFKKIITITAALLLLIMMLAACSVSEEINADITGTGKQPLADANSSQTTALASSDVDLDFVNIEFSSADEDSTYDENSAVKISLSDSGSHIDGSGAAADGDVITISQEGEYVISGTLTDGQIVIDASKDDVVQIILDNAKITNKNGSAILVTSAKKLVITLAQGSTNTVKDGEEYKDDSDDAPDASIYADEDLTINGSGSLEVVGNYKNGIKSVDDLIIMSGQIYISASEDGIRGKDSLIIAGGNVTVAAGTNGLKANNSGDDQKGYIAIEGGEIEIVSGDIGIQAESAILFDSGTVNITSEQDSVNCNGTIVVAGGDITLSAGDDGMHANDILKVVGGSIKIAMSYEGLEGAMVSIAGGNISIKASDDGINAAGGNDGDMRPNDMFDQSGSYSINISGGTVYIDSGGDGVDSNGGLFFSGGITTISGPTESMNGGVDSNGQFEISGGTLVVLSSSGMMETPETAAQPVLTVVFDSNQQAGSSYSVKDNGGNTVASFTSVKTYQCVMITSPDFVQGEAYTFSSGGTYSGDRLNEVLYTDGGISGDVDMFTFTFSDNVTTLDQNGSATALAGGFGGNMGGMGGKPGPR